MKISPKIIASVVIALLIGAGIGFYTGQSVGYNAGFEAGKSAVSMVEPVNLRFATGSPGMSSYARGAAMGEVFTRYLPKGSSVDVVPLGGYISYPEVVSINKADIGVTPSTILSWCKDGIGPYTAKFPNLRAIAGGMGPEYLLIWVRSEVPINSIEDIKAKKYPLRLITMAKGSAGEYAAGFVLEAYGLSYDVLKSFGGSVTHTSWPTTSDLIGDKLADGFIGMVQPGQAQMTEIAFKRDLRYLTVSEKVIKKFVAEYGFAEAKFPAGSYKGMDKDLPTVGMSLVFFCRAELPNSVVYTILKATVENVGELALVDPNLKDFDLKNAIKDLGAPLHQGAITYYKEKGLM